MCFVWNECSDSNGIGVQNGLEYAFPLQRRIIQGSTNKCESFNNFAGWVYFADSMIRENVKDEQVKIVK